MSYTENQAIFGNQSTEFRTQAERHTADGISITINPNKLPKQSEAVRIHFKDALDVAGTIEALLLSLNAAVRHSADNDNVIFDESCTAYILDLVTQLIPWAQIDFYQTIKNSLNNAKTEML